MLLLFVCCSKGLAKYLYIKSAKKHIVKTANDAYTEAARLKTALHSKKIWRFLGPEPIADLPVHIIRIIIKHILNGAITTNE